MIPGLDELITRLLYQFLYTFALMIWNFNRMFLAIAEFIQNIEAGLIDNVGNFVEYMTNALRVPTVMFLLLAITSIGTWYLLNNVLPTKKWVDPSRLLIYGLLTALFFAAPTTYIETLEALRTSLISAIDFTVIDDGVANIFDAPTIGTGSGYDDIPMPAAIPDLNADGAIATFDFVGFFLSIQNSNEIHRSHFPDFFADNYFPNTPSEIDLSSEGERNAAIERANNGLIVLFLSFLAMPAAIAEHTLWLALTLVALLIYIGVPIAMMLSFFIFTESLFANYIRQFIKLMIETFLSTLFAGFAIGVVSLAAQVGTAVYLSACIVATFIFIWRIVGAMKLATHAFDLFGGGFISGGATTQDARQVASGAIQTVGAGGKLLAGTAATAIGLVGAGAALGGAGLLQLDKRVGNQYGQETGILFDNQKTDNRVRQLQALAGYSAGKIKPIRRGIENTHEAITFGRNLMNGGAQQDKEPNALDYLRAGAAASNFGSSPWLAMRMSPSLRRAMDTVGGKTDGIYYDDQAPVQNGNGAFQQLNQNLSQLVNALNVQHGISSIQSEEGNQASTQTRLNPNEAIHTSDAPHNQGRGEAGFTAVSPETARARSAPTQAQEDFLTTINPKAGETAVSQELTPNTAPSISISSIQQGEQHATAVSNTIQALGAGGSFASNAYTQIEQAVGTDTANVVQTAVQDAGAEQVQIAAQASIDVAEAFSAEGMNDQEILQAFQSGEGISKVEERLGDESPFSQEQLHAITDVALQPTRDVSPQELASALGTAVENNGNTTDVAAALGSQITNMSAVTGEVRGIIRQAQQLNLNTADMRQIAAQLEQNLINEVRQLLGEKPGTSSDKESFITNMNNLQSMTLTLSQTTNPGGQPDA